MQRNGVLRESYVSEHVASANKTLVPWTIVTLDPVDRFVDLYQSIQAGKFSIVKTSFEISDALKLISDDLKFFDLK